jgi:FkbM family methyltransferase
MPSQLSARLHNVRSMLRASAGAGGKLAVAKIVAGRSSESEETVPLPMKALDGAPLFVRPGTSDAYNATWYYLDSIFSPPHMLSERPRIIWELGSNIGAALTALGVAYPGAQLLGVEPDPKSAAVLRRNTERFGDRCTIVESGVWDEEGDLVIDDSSEYGSHGHTTRMARPGDEGMTTVRVTTLDALLDSHLADGERVDYMHVSVEGAEPRVFSEGRWSERVRSLKVELHPYAGYGLEECRRQFEGQGYRTEPDRTFPDKWLLAVRD